MTPPPDRTPQPLVAGPAALERLLRDQPPPVAPLDADDEIRRGRRLAVLDDDPTGTQSIADLPVLTSWGVDDLVWAFDQGTVGFFVLTNTRSLSEADAAERNRQVVRALEAAARRAGDVAYAIASRSDSTLRGHYPLETDVLTRELQSSGRPVDAVVICPAYPEAGRVTIDSVHWMRTSEGMLPVAYGEFARDATFGYVNSDLRAWVEEKSAGRVDRTEVARITLRDIRVGGPGAVERILAGLTYARPVVVDAVDGADLEVVALALVRAEARGMTFLYRVGPSFVRARCGQRATPSIPPGRLAQLMVDQPAVGDDDRVRTRCGLVVVGSHVTLTTGQLDTLRARGRVLELELQVPLLLDKERRDVHVAEIAAQATAVLRNQTNDRDVVVTTSRTLVTGRDSAHSLTIARTVSAALMASIRAIVAQVRPAFVVAKGGITSSDTATEALGIRRAWARGPMLPGIVSLWEPVTGPAAGIPFVVFAGNVGDSDALADVVSLLTASRQRKDVRQQPEE